MIRRLHKTGCCCAVFCVCVYVVAYDLITRKGEQYPVWLRYTMVRSAGSITQFLPYGYVPPEAAPRYRGFMSHETTVAGETGRGNREINLGTFFAGEVWRLGRNLSLLELGCGRGRTTYSLNTVAGVHCLGLDGWAAIESLGTSNYRQWDLNNFFPMENLDFALSFEVGEHVKDEEAFFRTLLQAREGIVLAWAALGQGGHGHINERGQSYLISQIETNSSLRYCTELSHHLSQNLWGNFDHFYEYGNIMVFLDKGSSVPCDMPMRSFAVLLGYSLLAALLMLLWVIKRYASHELCPAAPSASLSLMPKMMEHRTD
eukprot:TRINITY_DN51885_c0_g1_i1.p1 TRINITY_DN51885_c0_g1~~TRINITY_DN51885_c0_g1_i1.p1  ORF type:complete len:316 (-),score=30.53 TRINITY_DN51885_c0_g1_i1:5-952(-)